MMVVQWGQGFSGVCDFGGDGSMSSESDGDGACATVEDLGDGVNDRLYD